MCSCACKAALPDGCQDGSQMIPNDWKEVGEEQGSKWEQVVEEIDGIEATRLRLVECPAGYAMSYKADTPQDDDCVPCEFPSYRLNRANRNSSGGSHRLDSETYENTTGCVTCDVTFDLVATCNFDAVIAKTGFWQLQFHDFEDYVYVKEAECEVEGAECLFPRYCKIVC